MVAPNAYSEAELDAAIAALEEPEGFREAEAVVSSAAPKLQRVLLQALDEGGWFGESHDAEVLKAATNPNDEERLSAVRTLLAEEARVGMMVGVAVGWALAAELRVGAQDEQSQSADEKSGPVDSRPGAVSPGSDS